MEGEERMLCRNCGVENPEDATFCKNCGGKLCNDVVQDYRQQPGGPAYHTKPIPPTAAIQPVMVTPYPAYKVQRNDGLCITSMVLGIIGLVLFLAPYISIPCGVLAIIFGAIGIKNVQQNPELKTGHGMGVAGLVTGILALLGGIVMIIVYVSVSTW